MKIEGTNFLVSILGLVGILSVSCQPSAETNSGDAELVVATTWATPDWKDRKTWYVTTQGSHLIDYDVFLALEQRESQIPFASQDSLEGLGFVYPPDEARGVLT